MSSRRSSRLSQMGKPQKQYRSPGVSTPSEQTTLDKYLVACSKRKQTGLPVTDQQQSATDLPLKRRQQFHMQNQWVPITSSDQISTRTLVPSPVPPTEKLPCTESMVAAGASYYSFKNIFSQEFLRKTCPLPALTWGNREDVWSVMKAKEKKYRRDSCLMNEHPLLHYRMRTILLDWIIEVCEVYKLHRETFYLAVDFIDRYLSIQKNVQKYRLQLIGVTALFIAAKIEEIYPPKITEFAYVTDGACSDDDIVKQELIMLKTLKWDLTPITINGWMTLYLNVLNQRETGGEEVSLTQINYSRHAFVTIVRLMDMCVLDEGSLQFPYSILAAAVLYHFGSEAATRTATGYTFEEIEKCVNWLAPFALTTREMEDRITIRRFDSVMESDCHNIQTHDITIEVFDKAKARQKLLTENSSRASPDITGDAPEILTPPPTKHKHSTPLPAFSSLTCSIAESPSPSTRSLARGSLGGVDRFVDLMRFAADGSAHPVKSRPLEVNPPYTDSANHNADVQL